jgi:DNA-binding transcriptional regulator YhcF (GntR family)
MKGRRRSNKPQYQQIADQLRDELVSLADQPAQALPSEESLSRVHGAARGTIRSALQVLEGEGLIRRSAGRVAITVPEGIRAWRRMEHRRRIHVIVPHDRPAGSWFDLICQGILTAARQAGYTCTLEEMFRFPSFSQGLRPQDPGQVAGVIAVGTLDERLLAMHAEAGYPVVCVDFVSSHPRVDAVVTDCFAEGQQAVEFLLRHGHREFFYIGKNIRSTVSPHERPEPDAVLMEAGYRYALRLAGLSSSVDRVRFLMPYQADYG